MKNYLKKYANFFAKMYACEHIFLPSSDVCKYLETLGFSFSGACNGNFFECCYPAGWFMKPRWSGDLSIASIYDCYNRERVIIAFRKWRKDQISLPEFRIVPRFEICSHSGCFNTSTTRVFVLDHGYPFGHPKNMFIDRNLQVTQEEVEKNRLIDGPTQIQLLKEVVEEIVTQYPDFQNPEAYWREILTQDLLIHALENMSGKVVRLKRKYKKS